jgi:hypothetical protein
MAETTPELTLESHLDNLFELSKTLFKMSTQLQINAMKLEKRVEALEKQNAKLLQSSGSGKIATPKSSQSMIEELLSRVKPEEEEEEKPKCGTLGSSGLQEYLQNFSEHRLREREKAMTERFQAYLQQKSKERFQAYLQPTGKEEDTDSFIVHISTPIEELRSMGFK